MTSPTDELPDLPTGYRWRLVEHNAGTKRAWFALRIQHKRLTRMKEWVPAGSRPTGIVWGSYPTKRFLWWSWHVYLIDRVTWDTVAEFGDRSTLTDLRETASIALRDAWARGHDLKEAREVLR